jgi:signal transduction histidine kinase
VLSLSLGRKSGKPLPQRIAIRDHGPGIADTDLQQVLQPFVRLDESRSRPGSGLGLSLVKAIVEAHGGSVQLENADPGLRVMLLFAPQT